MAVPPQLLIMLAQEAKKKRKEVWQKTDSILRNTVAPAVSTTAGMINMYNDQSEDPNVGTGMWSGALQQGALGYQSGGLRGLVGGGVLGGITSGLTTLNRAEQKSISDENADLNKMYGSMVGDDLDLQMLLHGKTGGEVTSSNPENQTEFVPIQAEARMVKTKGRNGKIINKLVKEKLAFADGKISDVNAKKSHSEMPKDFVTDVVKAGTYVFPVFTKLNKKDLNSLVSYGQGNYEENGDNFEVSEIRLKDILGEDFQGSFAEAADIVDKKYPLSDVTDRSDRISVATNNDNARNRMLYINHLIRLNEAKMSGEPVEDMTISPEKKVRAGGYIRNMKTGGFVGDPPKKKPYSVSWNNSSSGAAEVNPVAKSEYATRESRETYKDNNKKQADIDERANAILKTKKPGEYSGEDIQLINSSTLKNKDIVVGDDNIAKSNAAQEKGDSWTAEGFKNSTQAVGDKLSLRRLPGVGEYIPGFFDVTKGIGDMASGLGEIPYDVQQGDYGAAAGKVALPLAVGAIGGIGAQNTGQFVNNIVNPVAGLFEGGIGTKKELKDLYDVVTNKKKPISGLNPNEKEILDSSRYVGGLVADGSTERSLTALENIKKRADRLSEDEFQKLTGFPKSQIDDRIEEMKNGLSKKNNEAEEFDYAAPLTQRQRAQYRDQGIFLGDEFDLTPDLNYLPPPPEELIIPGLSTNEAQRVNQIRTNLRGYTDNLTSIDPQLAGRIYRNDGTDFSFINNNSDFRLARRGLKWQEQRVGRIIRDEPSFISKIKDRVQNFEKPVPIDPATQTLVSSSFRGKGANPVQQVVKAYNEVKNAPKGSSFLSSGSLSADSYNRLTLPLIEKSLKEGLVDVNFHGYKMLNKMSFPEKAGISNEIILKEMNDKILSINKLTGKNYPLGEMAGDFIKYPEFTVKKLKKGGFVN